jgi:hypothetical protein
MPQLTSRRKRNPMAAAVLLLVLAGSLLAACGGSSNSATTTASTAGTSTSAKTPTTPGKAPAFADRFAALRECLKKEGVTLPTRKPGQHPGTGGFLGGAGAGLPAGVSKAKFEAALKKCGGNFAGGRGGFAGGTSRFSTPEGKKALAKFAACLRENGVKVGEPNTSGKGPIFNTTGVDTKSAEFAAAESKCRSDLTGAFGARPGAAPPGAAGAGAAG